MAQFSCAAALLIWGGRPSNRGQEITKKMQKTIGKQKLEQINWNAIGTELEPLEAYLEDIWKMLENNWNTHGKRLVNN